MDPAALFPVFQKPCLFKYVQVKRHLRLYHIERCNDIADAEFSIVKQLQYPEPRFFGKGLEHISEILHNQASSLIRAFTFSIFGSGMPECLSLPFTTSPAVDILYFMNP